MSSTRHRLAVYYGLRSDADLEARRKAGKPDPLTMLIGLPLGAAVLVAVLGGIVWLERLVSGGDTRLASVAWTGVRLLWALLVFGAFVRAIGWVRRRRAGGAEQLTRSEAPPWHAPDR